MKSVTIAVETLASPDEVVDIVAARIPLTSRPLSPTGISATAKYLHVLRGKGM